MNRKILLFLVAKIILLFGCNGGAISQLQIQPTIKSFDASSNEEHGLVYQSGSTLWLLDLDQNTRTPLLESVSFASTVSDDFSQIAYSTTSQDLWILVRSQVPARQVKFDQLTELDLSINRLKWSPDNNKLAVLTTSIEDPQDFPEEALVFVVDLTTDDVQQIGCGMDFEWLSNSNQLVVNKMFCSNEEGVHIVDMNDLSSKQLFEQQTEIIAIAASPVNDEIAFIAGGPLEQNLYIGELSSDTITQLLDGSTGLEYQSLDQPVWSPDGRNLALIATVLEDNNLANRKLIVIESLTQEVKEVSPQIRGPLTWSLTGEAIATTIMTSTKGIYQIDIRSGDIQKLTDDRLATPTNFMWK